MSLAHWLAFAQLSLHPTATAPTEQAAPELPLVLDWQAPGDCPQVGAVTALVTGVLRRRSPSSLPTPLFARARVTRDGAGAWILRLELSSLHGQHTRVLQAAECPLLARAAALVLAVQLDPVAPGRAAQVLAAREPDEPTPTEPPKLTAPGEPPAPTAPGDPPEQPAPVPPTPSDVAVTVPVPAPFMDRTPRPAPTGPGPRIAAPTELRGAPARDDLRAAAIEAGVLQLPPPVRPRPPLLGHLRLEGGLELGLLPGPGGLVGLAGGLVVRGVRLELGVLAAPLRTHTPVDQPGARLDRLAATVRVCPGWTDPRGRLTLAGCVGAELGQIRAAGLAVALPNTLWAPWAAVTVGPAARVRLLGPLGLRLGVDAVVALVRPEFTAGADSSVYQVTRAGLRLLFAVDLQFVARKRRARET